MPMTANANGNAPASLAKKTPTVTIKISSDGVTTNAPYFCSRCSQQMGSNQSQPSSQQTLGGSRRTCCCCGAGGNSGDGSQLNDKKSQQGARFLMIDCRSTSPLAADINSNSNNHSFNDSAAAGLSDNAISPDIVHNNKPSTSTLSCPASFKRRISLPAEAYQAQAKNHIVLSEALGLVTELLSQRNIPANVVTGLKFLVTLLNNANFQLSPSTYVNDDLIPRFQAAIPTPFVAEPLCVSPNVLSRRASPVTWSTVTSATGLPTLEPEPNRPRSSSFWREKLLEDDVDLESSPIGQIDTADKIVQINDGTIFDIDTLNNDENYANIERWSLPVFDLYRSSPNALLSKMAYAAFSQSGLFKTFRISMKKFFNFFHTLGKGYWKMPYHNVIHAADVLHAIYYFTNNPIPALDNRAGGLAGELSALELMALYTAGAMHDFDHPGRTNAFLVATGDPKAILYNDRSVLENHHASSAWKLLSKSPNNFIEHLDPAEYKRFRFIVMEAILATDLKRHFEILVEFNEKINSRGADWKCEGDRLLIMQICIKMADINSPTKPFFLHTEWTRRIVEEFYLQGDAERSVGLPVSAFMDREEPQVAKLQDSFISHLVRPLVLSMQSAGFLSLNIRKRSNAAISLNFSSRKQLRQNSASYFYEASNDTSNRSSTDETDDAKNDFETSNDESSIYVSELIQNIDDNLEYWKKELGENSTIDEKTINLTVEPAVKFDSQQQQQNDSMTIIDENEEKQSLNGE
uniref:Phosphodiesterase n=1 Tax=Romanomermis culicivorax TaxID=13658 RepID=A0A915KCW2_ROMCU